MLATRGAAETQTLIGHFGEVDGDTHDSARFATIEEVAPLTRSEAGLPIGRDGKTGKLLRYDGPAHLLTMAPARTGIQRFLRHVLPRGFHRIRHYGLLATPSRKASLALTRQLLEVAPAPTEEESD